MKKAFYVLFLFPAVAHASPCIEPAYATAFHKDAIRSEMMVSAEICHWQSYYNQTVGHWPGWGSDVLNDWFRHHGGESAHLKYTTLLANNQSFQDYKDYHIDVCYHRRNMYPDSPPDPDVFYVEQHINMPYEICKTKGVSKHVVHNVIHKSMSSRLHVPVN